MLHKTINRQSFTIIEMLVVLAMSAILIASLVPTLSQYLPGVNLSGSTRDLLSNLREAQERAITEQNQFLIRFDLSANPKNYKLISIVNSVEEVIRQIDFPESVSVSIDPSITDNQIIFSPDGGPSASGNINLSAGGNNKIISVSPAGFIKSE